MTLIIQRFYDFFEWDFDPMVPFPPVVEPRHEGAFITEDPRFAIPHGQNIPWLTGITSEEGLLKTAAFLNDENLQQRLNLNWDFALPVSLFYDHLDKNKQDQITQLITNFYFGGEAELNEHNVHAFTDLYSDNWFIMPMIEYIKKRLQHSNHAQTYVYLYTHQGCCSFTEPFQGHPEKYYGTSHADDLLALFPAEKTKPFFTGIPTEADKNIKKVMTKLFVNFASFG